ncbi:MAG: EFR1 family ferrodoxin [Victivallales bacterium]|nr:EFR1 family ferrodoxin [Victivallales bacterium]
MKTALYYFSGTGNTLMLARMLADELGDTEIINIAGCSEAGMPPEADAVGILFPVYAFGMPRIMRNFIRNILKVPEEAYVFAVSDYAGAGGAAALKLLRAELRRKDIVLRAGFGFVMPSNYLPFGGADSLEKQDKLFTDAAAEIKDVARIIRQRPERYFYKKSLLPRFLVRLMHGFFLRDLPKEAGKFYVNANCTSCGLCVKLCPTDNIKLHEGRPVWGENCEQCFACLQWCPETAIHRRGVPEERAHYHNPNLTANDLLRDMHRE